MSASDFWKPCWPKDDESQGTDPVKSKGPRQSYYCRCPQFFFFRWSVGPVGPVGPISWKPGTLPWCYAMHFFLGGLSLMSNEKEADKTWLFGWYRRVFWGSQVFLMSTPRMPPLEWATASVWTSFTCMELLWLDTKCRLYNLQFTPFQHSTKRW